MKTIIKILLALFIFLCSYVFSQAQNLILVDSLLITPISMNFSKNVSSYKNVKDPLLKKLFFNDTNSILLGVNPDNANDLGGGIASLKLNFSKYMDLNYFALLTISWEKNYNGVFSNNIDSIVTVYIDSIQVWSMKCTQKDTSNKVNYFAIKNPPIISSFRIKDTQTLIEIVVPATCSFGISFIKIEIYSINNIIK
ncbi:MAG: hypothetical protein HW421_2086 [Ignavibacteria bacterium]|nr:hypothetical protein [Ignavibacteria bacterium]